MGTLFVASGDRWIFAGDSITDCERRGNFAPYGNGYVKLVIDMITAKYPELDIEFLNRGIGGDTSRNLKKRWCRDVIEENPTIVSISVGVNDLWGHKEAIGNNHIEGDEVSLEEYIANYREMLEATKKIDAKVILMEISLIEKDPNSIWNKMLVDYNKVIHQLAEEYDSLLCPIHQAFANVVEKRPEIKWTWDSVHPTSVGHTLMALTLLDTIGW